MSEREDGRNPASEPKQQKEGNEVEELKKEIEYVRSCIPINGVAEGIIARLAEGIIEAKRYAYERGKKEVMNSDFISRVREQAKKDERARIVNVINKHKLVVTSMDTQMTEKSVHNQCCRDIISKIQGV